MIKKILFGNKGMALAIIAIMLLILATFCIVFLFMSKTEMQRSQHDEDFVKTLPLAETGLERAIWVLTHDDTISAWDAPETVTVPKWLYGCTDPDCPFKDSPSQSLNNEHTTCKNSYKVKVELYDKEEFGTTTKLKNMFQQAAIQSPLNLTWVKSGYGGDFNNDGKEDLIVGGNTGNYNLALFLNSGVSPYFSPSQLPSWSTSVSNRNIKGIVCGDFNGDNKEDFITYGKYTNTNKADYTLYRGNGQGNFTSGNTFFTELNTVSDPWDRTIGVGDVNGDGKTDIAIPSACNDGQVKIFINKGGNPPYNTTPDITINAFTNMDLHGTALVDLDNDGDPDVVATSVRQDEQSNNQVKIFQNNGGSFISTPVKILNMPQQGSGIDSQDGRGISLFITGDFDGDSDIDIIAGTDSSGGGGKDGDGGHLYFIENKGNINQLESLSVENAFKGYYESYVGTTGVNWHDDNYQFAVDFDSGGPIDINNDGFMDFMIGDGNNSGVGFLFLNMASQGDIIEAKEASLLYRLTVTAKDRSLTTPAFPRTIEEIVKIGKIAGANKLNGALVTKDSLTISGNVEITGDVYNTGNVDVQGSANIDGYLYEDQGFTLPTVQIPDNAINISPISLYGQQEQTLTKGVYVCNSITMNGQSKLITDGEIYLYCTGAINIGGGSQVNPDGSAPNFHLYSNGASIQLFGNDTKFVGTIYAPNIDIQISGTPQIRGQIIAKGIQGQQLTGDVTIIYDQALKGDIYWCPWLNLKGARTLAWREISR